MTDAVRVTDPQALRALAHPLRLKLLGLLRLEGPSTATLLGRRLGESSGATSYHLRELARFGFVGEDAGRGSGRERWWQALHRSTDWDPGAFGESDVVDALERQLLERRRRVTTAWLQQRTALDNAWRGSSGLSDAALRLTPEQSRAFTDEVLAVVDRWAVEHDTAAPAEGTELVAVHLDVLPLREWPL